MRQRGKVIIPKKRAKQTTATRVTGDSLLYFIFHNSISVFFFFLFTINIETYDMTRIPASYLFSSEFWKLVIYNIFFISLVCGIIGRVGAYSTIVGYYYFRNRKRTKQKTTKRWGELNSGINQFNIIVFVLTAFITSVIYALGVVVYLQHTIFGTESFVVLVGIYILFKVGIYFGVRWLTKAKT